jgi:diguanylate cyclase (GGDEF)-like protein
LHGAAPKAPEDTLPNRRRLLDDGERRAAQAIATRSAACVLMIDLGHVSDVNRTFGHAGGDRPLIAFATSARQAPRAKARGCNRVRSASDEETEVAAG